MGFGHASGVATAVPTIVLTIISSVMVVSRIGTRVFIAHCFGIEDIFIIFAFIFAITLCVFTVIETLNGLGQHEYYLEYPYAWLMPLFHTIWTYYLAMFCTKFSILIQYNRILPQKLFRATYIMMAFCIAFVTWEFFSAIFTCVPVRKFWNPQVYFGGCLSLNALWFTNAGINIMSDLIITILPLPVFKALELPRKQKLGLMGIFGLGGFVCVVSIIRLPALYEGLQHNDRSYYYPGTAIWSMVEVNTGIVCSCLPTLRALVSRFWPKAFTTKELKSMTTNASDGQYTKVFSENAMSMAKSSSDRSGVPASIQGSEITSHAMFRRNENVEDRSTRSEEAVSVPIPANIPPGAAIHIFTTVDQNSERRLSSPWPRSSSTQESALGNSRSRDAQRVRFNSCMNQYADFRQQEYRNAEWEAHQRRYGSDLMDNFEFANEPALMEEARGRDLDSFPSVPTPRGFDDNEEEF
ncbi:hypothetical protein EJ03DRAFT_353871 [Teratosphaeria nubilosa]|uniref:Rhodopsin domain-containing protein n=1 Tax=Teratosphaeria nubilosa TaxID=161662 RepID=A0A6G1L1D7_9PEZI|nr:hypothetical protein EJ03DRAFT_353871 [Teratosphaeria nubilosa]